MIETSLTTIIGLAISVLILVAWVGFLVLIIAEVVCLLLRGRRGRTCPYEMTRLDFEDLRRKAEWNANER
ncbi:MAG: hypothetical protein NZM00_07005 [Anaerolinea sp.]|nr:hypothetical protein [Anaerolinea sp.]